MEWLYITIIVVLFIILIAASCCYDELRKENSNNEMLLDLTKKELSQTEKELQKVKFERDISLSKNNYYEQRESWRIERIKVLENSNDKIREHNSKLQEELDRLNKQKEDANSIPFNVKFFDPYEFKDTFGSRFMQDIINKELGIVPDGKISPKEDSKGCTNPYDDKVKIAVEKKKKYKFIQFNKHNIQDVLKFIQGLDNVQDVSIVYNQSRPTIKTRYFSIGEGIILMRSSDNNNLSTWTVDEFNKNFELGE